MTAPPPRKKPESFPEWIETWVLPYLDQSALWPVAAALLGHLAVFVAPIILIAWRTQHPAVFLFLMVLMGISGHICVSERQYRGHLGSVTVTVVALWALAGSFAAICEYTGIM